MDFLHSDVGYAPCPPSEMTVVSISKEDCIYCPTMPEGKMQLILGAAKAARAWAIQKASENGFSSNLGGMCGIASRRLHKELEAVGLPAEVAIYQPGGWGAHVFVICCDHIVDITASQFSMAEICVLPYPSPTVHNFWKATYRFSTAEAALQHQERVGWCKSELRLASGD